MKELAPRLWMAFTRWWPGRFWPVFWPESPRGQGLGLALQRIPIRHPASGAPVVGQSGTPTGDEVGGHPGEYVGRAITGGCLVAFQLNHLLADARVELNRSVAVGTAYIVEVGLLILLALRFQSSDVRVIAAAVAAAEVLLSPVLGPLGYAMAGERRP